MFGLFKVERRLLISKLNIGDHILYTDKNLNHLNSDVCAYAGTEGEIFDIWEDGISIFTGSSYLVVPLKIKGRKKSVNVIYKGISYYLTS